MYKKRVGNRDLIMQWCVIPNGMNYYSLTALAEHDLLKLTFDGVRTRLWNPIRSMWENGYIFCVPLRMTLDNPEVQKWTGVISQGGVKQSRYSTLYFAPGEGYKCHTSTEFSAWITGQILYGNVKNTLSFMKNF